MPHIKKRGALLVQLLFFIIILSTFVESEFVLDEIDPATGQPMRVPASEAGSEIWNDPNNIDQLAQQSGPEIQNAIKDGRMSTDTANKFFADQENAGKFPEAFKEYTQQKYDGLEATTNKGDTLEGDTLTTTDGTDADLSTISKDKQLESTGEGLKVKDANGESTFSGAEGLREDEGWLTADKMRSGQYDNQNGESFYLEDAEGVRINTNPKDGNYQVEIGKADFELNELVGGQRIAFQNLHDAVITSRDKNLEVKAKEDGIITMLDQGKNLITAHVPKGAKMVIAKEPEPRYNLDQNSMMILPQYNLVANITGNNSEITLSRKNEKEVHLTGRDIFVQHIGQGMMETLWAKGESTIRAHKEEGIYYAELGHPSRLSVKNGNLREAFNIYRPHTAIGKFYTVINKPSYKYSLGQFKETYKDEEGAYINLEDHKMYFQGIFEYSKPDERDRAKNLIESFNKDNKIDIDMDENNEKFSMDIRNDYDCFEEEILTSTHNFDYNIIEICNPLKSKVERYVSFEHVGTPHYINNYQSFFKEKHMPIVFSGELLMIKKPQSTSIFITEKNSEQFYKSEMYDYNKHFSECVSYNQDIFRNIKNTIFDWFIQ